MVAVISWWAPDPPVSEFALKLLLTNCENFAVEGGISPLFLTVKISPRNSPLLKPPAPVRLQKEQVHYA